MRPSRAPVALRRPVLVSGLALVLVAALEAHSGEADAHAQAPDPLLAVHSADPLELARVVDRIGDDAVLDRLPSETPLAVRLLAVRASPWLHAPELALAPLTALAAGRDPDLAPAAALAILRIAERLDRAELDAREAGGDEIEAALAPLGALAADVTARADLRRGAAVAGSYLEPLVRPSGAGASETAAVEATGGER